MELPFTQRNFLLLWCSFSISEDLQASNLHPPPSPPPHLFDHTHTHTHTHTHFLLGPPQHTPLLSPPPHTPHSSAPPPHTPTPTHTHTLLHFSTYITCHTQGLFPGPAELYVVYIVSEGVGMVAPAICDGHVKRSLVRVSSRVTDINAGVMVVDLARGSSLAALVPVNSYFDPFVHPRHHASSSSTSSRQSSTSQALKGQTTQVPWSNSNNINVNNNNQPISQQQQQQQQSTASQPSVTSSSTTTTTRGQNTPRPANAVPRSAILLTSLSGVQRQSGVGVSVTTSSTPRLSLVGIPASMRNHNSVRGAQIPVTRPTAAAPGSVQGQRIGVMTQAPRQRNTVATHAAASNVSTNVQVSDEIVGGTRNIQQRGNNINNNASVSVVAAAGVPVGKRKLEEKPEVNPCRNETPRPAKLPRTDTHTRKTQPLIPCPHNPQLVEENQRLRQVVQGLMQELGRCRQLLHRSQSVGTGVTVH
ncbi:hypothetical protein Pcinc_030853 [Petrolisthes cinctipes]|uniref:Uncharacterized protein n=1 Tax=Petrolisthes cinctipes TaxID=88211 RepID=A0AAE1EXV7_PETCI|nr:hypothetical protein Pcinc_030853 [Petrolisthes cinctipes]